MAPISDARRRANEKYTAKAYDNFLVRVGKGKKEEIASHAQRFGGKSLNKFVNEAIDEKMERDKGKKD